MTQGSSSDPQDAPILVIHLPIPPPGEEPYLVDALRRSGAWEVTRDRTRVKARFFPEPSPSEVLLRVRLAINASTSLTIDALDWCLEPGRDWEAEWVEAFPPRPVGRRLCIIPCPGGARPFSVPRGCEAHGEDRVAVYLRPGTAFGTVEHPTTLACLELLEGRILGGERFADVGGGSGILSMAALKLGAARGIAYEKDSGACKQMKKNAVANQVEDRFEVRETVIGAAGLGKDKGLDLIVANLPGPHLLPLIPGLAQALVPGGSIILSGFSGAESRRASEVMVASGLAPEQSRNDSGWRTHTGIRKPESG